jgi:hypothetical protein
MSEHEMRDSAATVRSIDGTLRTLVGQLVSAGVWSGPDAERFAADWTDQVHVPLINAAAKMDAISYEPLV